MNKNFEHKTANAFATHLFIFEQVCERSANCCLRAGAAALAVRVAITAKVREVTFDAHALHGITVSARLCVSSARA